MLTGRARHQSLAPNHRKTAEGSFHATHGKHRLRVLAPTTSRPLKVPGLSRGHGRTVGSLGFSLEDTQAGSFYPSVEHYELISLELVRVKGTEGCQSVACWERPCRPAGCIETSRQSRLDPQTDLQGVSLQIRTPNKNCYFGKQTFNIGVNKSISIPAN